MSKMRTVTRKYYSKKLGKYVSKSYTYEVKRTSPYTGTIIYKSGKVNTKLLNKIRSGANLLERIDIDSAIDDFRYGNEFKTKRLSYKSLMSRIARNQIESFIINTGYSTEELAIELSAKFGVEVDLEYVLSEDHWKDGDLILPDGQIAEFRFSYEGSIIL